MITAFGTNDPLTAKIYSKDWIDSSIDRSYFSRHGFVGEDPSAYPIWLRRDLQAQQGDTIYLGNVQELDNAGVSGDNQMEDSEEEMDTYDDALIVDQVRNAVRLEGRMTEQRAAAKLRKYVKSILKNWMANKIDQDGFTAMSSSPTRVFYGGTSTATSDITSSSKLTTTVVSKLVANAQSVTPEIMPVMVDGVEVWVVVASISAGYDFKQTAASSGGIQDFLEQAMPRGSKNPLFTRANFYWDGAVIHTHRHVSTATTWGAGGDQPGASNLFMGAHAGALGYAKKRIWVEKLFDYDNSPGACVGAIYGWTKLTFNSEDSACQMARTYATTITEST